MPQRQARAAPPRSRSRSRRRRGSGCPSRPRARSRLRPRPCARCRRGPCRWRRRRPAPGGGACPRLRGRGSRRATCAPPAGSESPARRTWRLAETEWKTGPWRSCRATGGASASTGRSCAATGSAGSGTGSRLKASCVPKTGVGVRRVMATIWRVFSNSSSRPTSSRIETGWITVAATSSGERLRSGWRRWASSTTAGWGDSSTRFPVAEEVLTPATTGRPSSTVASKESTIPIVSGGSSARSGRLSSMGAAEEGHVHPLQALRLPAADQGGGPADLRQGADLVFAGAQQAHLPVRAARVDRLAQLLAQQVGGMKDGDGRQVRVSTRAVHRGGGGSSGRGPRPGRSRARAAPTGADRV